MSVVSGGPRRHGRRTIAVLALLILAVAGIAFSLAVGHRAIALPDVWGALFGGLDSDNATVVTSQRLPRTLLGLGAGAALGIAGALMQGHTRNPLADPGLFGVNAGASFAVALLTFVAGHQSSAAIAVAALVGAGIVSTIVFVIGLGGLRGGTLVLTAVVGTTLTALLTALTTALLLLDRTTMNTLRFWEVGSLAGRDTSLSPILLPIGVIGLVLALANARTLDALSLGDDVASSLGHDVRSSRVVGIVAVTLLAGAATSICGPIVFVGLVAPHLARALIGHDYRWIVPAAGLVGAALLLVADTLGRIARDEGELQAGLVVAVIGGPVLLAICRRRRLVSL